MGLLFLLASLLVLSRASTNYSHDKHEQTYPITGTFWQLTDIHWDLRYTENGDPKAMCHANGSSGNNNNGYFGNYFCDSPWALVKSAMIAMKHFQEKPDFILWTGDNAPHSRDPNPDFDVIFKTISNLTEELKTRFAGIKIIPVLGNHDVYPSNEYPVNSDSFYKDFLMNSGWKTILSEEAQKEFPIGGYFSSRISSNLSILSLNTNLYLRPNKLGTQSEDPADQFKWIKTKLQETRKNMEKVIIAAHAPPGYWERTGKKPFFNETYNDNYVNLLGAYGDVIVAHIYGHEHTDAFRLFNFRKGTESVAFLAPSLSPWFPPGNHVGTPINPSVRLYTYNSSEISDYDQYHLNLTEANDDETAASICTFGPTYDARHCEEKLLTLWKLYYKATTAFSVSTLNVAEISDFNNRLRTNDSLMQTYYLINSAGVEHSPCNSSCKQVFFCAIDHLLISDFTQCIMPTEPSTTYDCDAISESECAEGSMGAHVLVAGVVATISLTVMLGIMLIIVLARRKKTILLGSTSTEFQWTNRHQGYRPLSGDAD